MDENLLPVNEETPAPKKRITKQELINMISLYQKIVVGALAVALVLLILLIIFIAKNSGKSSDAKALTTDYSAYASGDSAALEELRTLGEDYEPAAIVAELIDRAESAEAAQAAQEAQAADTFGDEDLVNADSSAVDDMTSDSDADSDALISAMETWNAGDYEEAKAAFDALADAGQLSFSLTDASSNDPVLEYAAVCGMLSLYDTVSTNLSYNDLLLYDYEPETAPEGFDVTKPVILFDTNSGNYLCAYSTSTNRYELMCSSDDDETTYNAVVASDKYDLLSASTVLTIRKQLQ